MRCFYDELRHGILRLPASRGTRYAAAFRASRIEKYVGDKSGADQSGTLIGQVNTSRAKGRAYAKKVRTREDGASGDGTEIVDFQLDRDGGTLAPEVTI